jgi:hypothetical protein
LTSTCWFFCGDKSCARSGKLWNTWKRIWILTAASERTDSS